MHNLLHVIACNCFSDALPLMSAGVGGFMGYNMLLSRYSDAHPVTGSRQLVRLGTGPSEALSCGEGQDQLSHGSRKKKTISLEPWMIKARKLMSTPD